jgi:hypothetical protein
MGQDGSVGRERLPIPHRPHIGLVTYDAKDPASSFPPIEPLRPAGGRAHVLVVLPASRATCSFLRMDLSQPRRRPDGPRCRRGGSREHRMLQRR